MPAQVQRHKRLQPVGCPLPGPDCKPVQSRAKAPPAYGLLLGPPAAQRREEGHRVVTGLQFLDERGTHHHAIGRPLRARTCSAERSPKPAHTGRRDIYTFRPGVWASLSTAYGAGGQTSVDGIDAPDRTDKTLWAISADLPVDRNRGGKATMSH
jgi:hypothetical protein